MDLKERGWEGMEQICLPHDKDKRLILVYTVMNLQKMWKISLLAEQLSTSQE
jgi:hypothetical protein